jgi:hypothetical protein
LGLSSIADADGILGSPEDLNHNGVLDGAASSLATGNPPFALSFEDYDGVIGGDGCHDSPGNDFDGDTFRDELEALFLGTNPTSGCPLTGEATGIDDDGDGSIDEVGDCANDEEPDPWPIDFDDNQWINIPDTVQMTPPTFNSTCVA